MILVCDIHAQVHVARESRTHHLFSMFINWILYDT